MSDADKLVDDPEFESMRVVHAALQPLDSEARTRVLDYVCQRLEISGTGQVTRPAPQPTAAVPATENPEPPEAEGDELGALSPVAAKWMRRNSLAEDELGKLYSIDLEEIDLIANEVPGDNKRAKAQNVLRLLGIGEYLASGAARVSHETLKEACLHYNAFDAGNHAATIRKMGREVSGSSEAGYTLTAAGIAAATSLIKEMIGTS